jgi:hypothetical protein
MTATQPQRRIALKMVRRLGWLRRDRKAVAAAVKTHFLKRGLTLSPVGR